MRARDGPGVPGRAALAEMRNNPRRAQDLRRLHGDKIRIAGTHAYAVESTNHAHYPCPSFSHGRGVRRSG